MGIQISVNCLAKIDVIQRIYIKLEGVCGSFLEDFESVLPQVGVLESGLCSSLFRTSSGTELKGFGKVC